jgi:hypothetical protein
MASRLGIVDLKVCGFCMAHISRQRGTVLDELVAFVLWPQTSFAFAIHINSFCHETFSSFFQQKAKLILE